MVRGSDPLEQFHAWYDRIERLSDMTRYTLAREAFFAGARARREPEIPPSRGALDDNSRNLARYDVNPEERSHPQRSYGPSGSPTGRFLPERGLGPDLDKAISGYYAGQRPSGGSISGHEVIPEPIKGLPRSGGPSVGPDDVVVTPGGRVHPRNPVAGPSVERLERMRENLPPVPSTPPAPFAHTETVWKRQATGPQPSFTPRPSFIPNSYQGTVDVIGQHGSSDALSEDYGPRGPVVTGHEDDDRRDYNALELPPMPPRQSGSRG